MNEIWFQRQKKKKELKFNEREKKFRKKIYDIKNKKVQSTSRRLRYFIQELTLKCWFEENIHDDKIKFREIVKWKWHSIKYKNQYMK